MSQSVKTVELEEVDMSEYRQPQSILVAKHLAEEFKKELTQTLREYQDVFAWSYEDMQSLDPQVY